MAEINDFSLNNNTSYITNRAHKLLEIKYRVVISMCYDQRQHFYQAMNSAIPGIFQIIPQPGVKWQTLNKTNSSGVSEKT